MQVLTVVACVLVFYVFVAVYRRLFEPKKPECTCNHCGWQGQEQELDAFTNDKETYWSFSCPNCHSWYEISRTA